MQRRKRSLVPAMWVWVPSGIAVVMLGVLCVFVLKISNEAPFCDEVMRFEIGPSVRFGISQDLLANADFVHVFLMTNGFARRSSGLTQALDVAVAEICQMECKSNTVVSLFAPEDMPFWDIIMISQTFRTNGFPGVTIHEDADWFPAALRDSLTYP